MVTALETRDYILELMYDSTPSNPMTDYDGMWSVVSFSDKRLHVTTDVDRDLYFPYAESTQTCQPTIGLRNKLRAGTAFILDQNRYDHTWALDMDSTDYDRCDGLIIWEHPTTDMGAKTREARAKDATGTLEEYNAFITGDVYGYSLELRGGGTITTHYSGTGKALPQTSDSCFGFFCADYFIEVLRTELLPDYAAKSPMRIKIFGDAAGLINGDLDDLPNVEIVKAWDDSADGEEIDEY